MEKEKTQGSTLAKLPYILLELINNESPESVDYIIARYILDHLTELSGASIQDISDACEVSKSTLSRFCRKAGLEDFQEMKNELQQAVELIKTHTRQYAKRQMTWFKRDKSIKWFGPEELNAMLTYVKPVL